MLVCVVDGESGHAPNHDQILIVACDDVVDAVPRTVVLVGVFVVVDWDGCLFFFPFHFYM